ncbi:hypothetical protein KAF25_005882 [Fusarium avenaceum]|uniref:Uncharacterized protein n=1 Tax=Fusarium avenaceum TaxID=40199 RepID=A0A9P7GZN7_9HYPO|nr:hypothetical protein KAF25_005882 [Fusarium avenaceum]
MLEEKLTCTELCKKVKQDIAAALWNTPPTEVEPSLNCYFKYYVEQCEIIALHEGGIHASVETHQDIITIAQLARAPKTPDEIRSQVCKGNGAHDHSIDLASRLLTMVEFGNLSYAFSGSRKVEWLDGSLQDLLNGLFRPAPVLGHQNVKLDKIFNALNLGTIAGIDIIWTNNLADHLRLMNDDKSVAIFHHASFIKRQQRDSTLYSQEFLNETLDTMALLFPKWDKKSRAWYEREASVRGLDSYLIEVGQLTADKRRLENFSFWRDRLILLKQVFDESGPENIWQWWYDRRNGVQWYTFWVAILVLFLTVFFGLVQSIEGALQVYKAFHPN